LFVNEPQQLGELVQQRLVPDKYSTEELMDRLARVSADLKKSLTRNAQKEESLSQGTAVVPPRKSETGSSGLPN
jgi:hypothetical protein